MRFVFFFLLCIGIGMIPFYFESNYEHQINVFDFEQNKIVTFPKSYGIKEIAHQLLKDSIIIDTKSFLKTAQKYKLQNRNGRFEIAPNLTNKSLVSLLLNGKQLPVQIIINQQRNLPDLAAYLSKNLEPDSLAFMETFKDETFLKTLGFTTENILSIFIPNTYEHYWNVSTEKFLFKMAKAYQKFWDESRLSKARTLGFSTKEIIILASIIEKETNYVPEMPRMAGVYINRLKTKGWKLEANPTLLFALNDFSIYKLTNKHRQFDSPYNSYKYPGLPPGPIGIPSIQTIDQTLIAEKHRYFFFCAKNNDSGQHQFSKDLRSHQKVAKAYHKWKAKKEKLELE